MRTPHIVLTALLSLAGLVATPEFAQAGGDGVNVKLGYHSADRGAVRVAYNQSRGNADRRVSVEVSGRNSATRRDARRGHDHVIRTAPAPRPAHRTVRTIRTVRRVTRAGPARHTHVVRRQRQVWVAGHHVVRVVRDWVPGRWERHVEPAVYRTRTSRDSCRSVEVLVRAEVVSRRWIPGHHSNRRVRKWVRGHYRTVTG